MAKDDTTYRFHHGGLMRCCLESLDDEMVKRLESKAELSPEGGVIKCQYCSKEMICTDGSWKWNDAQQT